MGGADVGSMSVFPPSTLVMWVANGVTGSDDIVVLDEKANHLPPKIDEQWADSDCETTILDDEDDNEEECERYDSDDTAFDCEVDDTLKLDPQPETPLKIEPEGLWISSEGITVGEAW